MIRPGLKPEFFERMREQAGLLDLALGSNADRLEVWNDSEVPPDARVNATFFRPGDKLASGHRET
jgi:hypothetical protein